MASDGRPSGRAPAVKLVTRDGGEVGRVQPTISGLFTTQPGVVLWGMRYFVRDEHVPIEIAPDGTPVMTYREVIAVAIPDDAVA